MAQQLPADAVRVRISGLVLSFTFAFNVRATNWLAIEISGKGNSSSLAFPVDRVALKHRQDLPCERFSCSASGKLIIIPLSTTTTILRSSAAISLSADSDAHSHSTQSRTLAEPLEPPRRRFEQL